MRAVIRLGGRADIAIWDVSGICSAGKLRIGALLLPDQLLSETYCVEGRRGGKEGRLLTIDLPRKSRWQNQLGGPFAYS